MIYSPLLNMYSIHFKEKQKSADKLFVWRYKLAFIS